MADAKLEEPHPQVKTPVIFEDGGKDTPMTMNERPGWVVDRPPVGQSIFSGDPIDPSFPSTHGNPPGPDDQDPTVINQNRTRDLPSMGAPGTPYTEDPETGFETNRTSPDMEDKREKAVKEQKAALKEEAKAEKEAAKAEREESKGSSTAKSESKSEGGSGSKA